VTTSNYCITISLIQTLCSSLQHALCLLSLLCLHQSSGNAFQWQTFPFLWVLELSLCLSYQLLTATAHKDWTAAVLKVTNSLTHSLHWLTPRLVAISHQSPTLLAVISRLSSNDGWPPSYSLGMDHIEKTSCNSSSIAASSSYRMDCVENTASQWLHCCVTNLLPSNGFTYHNIQKCYSSLYGSLIILYNWDHVWSSSCKKYTSFLLVTSTRVKAAQSGSWNSACKHPTKLIFCFNQHSEKAYSQSLFWFLPI
jgi:hypothetical protein